MSNCRGYHSCLRFPSSVDCIVMTVVRTDYFSRTCSATRHSPSAFYRTLNWFGVRCSPFCLLPSPVPHIANVVETYTVKKLTILIMYIFNDKFHICMIYGMWINGQWTWSSTRSGNQHFRWVQIEIFRVPLSHNPTTDIFTARVADCERRSLSFGGFIVHFYNKDVG
jgi:hypothetical protein